MTLKLHVNRVILNSNGFDSGGLFHGLDLTHLWHGWSHAADGLPTVSSFVRAPTRDAAKEALRAQFPGATFHR